MAPQSDVKYLSRIPPGGKRGITEFSEVKNRRRNIVEMYTNRKGIPPGGRRGITEFSEVKNRRRNTVEMYTNRKGNVKLIMKRYIVVNYCFICFPASRGSFPGVR